MPDPILQSPYIAPKELAVRWSVQRSTVDRIVRSAGLSRLCLGDGANGTVRYVRDEIMKLERERLTRSEV